MSRVQELGFAALLLSVGAVLPAQQIAIGEYPIPTLGSNPTAITAGPDGALWFIERSGNKIGRVTSDGAITEYPVPTANSGLSSITVGPDGALWFTEEYVNKIGRLTTAGVFTEYVLPSTFNTPMAIAGGRAGALWFTAAGNGLGQITTAGIITGYDQGEQTPGAIAIGPDGALWFTQSGHTIVSITTPGATKEYTSPFPVEVIAVGRDGSLWFGGYACQIGRLTAAGVITTYPLPNCGSSHPVQQINGITPGAGGAMWFTAYDLATNTWAIEQVTPAGQVTAYPCASQYIPSAITAGPDGELWFTDNSSNAIGEVFFVTASLAVTPNSGDYQTSLSFTGSGFASGETVQIYRQGVGPDVLATAGAGGSGSFTVQVPEPRLVPGQRLFVGVGQTSHKLGAASFTVTPQAQQMASQQHVVPTAGSGESNGITTGPDGALWFTETSANQIGRITTAGAITEYPTPTAYSEPDQITVGPDGALWFTEFEVDQIGRITTAGVITEYHVPTAMSSPSGITTGPDNALWFTENSAIGRITTAGAVTEYPVPTGNNGSSNITTGPDGALWFTERGANQIGRITTTGMVSEYVVPTAGSMPTGITAGPDGALWFTEWHAGAIGRITTAGEITEYPLTTLGVGHPYGITAWNDGALWFAADGAIGRITTAGVLTGFPTSVAFPFTGYNFAITPGPDGELWFTEGGNSQLNGSTVGEAFFPAANLSVSPDTGFYQTDRTFSGSGFAPNETVHIYTSGIGSAVLAAATADGSGSFAVSGRIPASPHGPRSFIALGLTSGARAAASFSVTPNIVLNPGSGAVGSSVTAQGYGFPPFYPIDVYWSAPRTFLGSVTPDANGTFTGSAALTFTVPAGASPGANRVQGTWNCGRVCPEAGYGPFTVE